MKVFITGISRGIGLALAEAMLQEKMEVYGTVRNLNNEDVNGVKDLNNIFLETLKSYKEGSRSRKQCATSLSVLAKFLEHQLPDDWKLMAKGYGLNKASFRDLPTDEFIEDLWDKIPNKSWKYVFGLMATYGLRNHEVFFCDLSSLNNYGDKILRVLPKIKFNFFI